MLILTLLGAILKLAWQVVALAIKIVYQVLKFTHLRLLALYLVVCGLLEVIMHPFSYPWDLLFWVGLAVCVLVTLFGWFARFAEKSKRKKLSREEKLRKKEEKKEKMAEREELPAQEEKPIPTKKPAYPQYYNVEGREGYMFAEYADRYELFRRESSGWTYVKTDYKQEND